MPDSGTAKWHLVCYDVRDPKRLRRCARKLEGTGTRLQYSVFRCRLTPAELARLQWELTEILEPEDEALFIPLCDRCVGGLKVTHSVTKEPDWPAEPPTHHVL